MEMVARDFQRALQDALDAEAYNQAPEFYAFLKSMELYPATLGTGSRLVLSTDSAFLRYLGEFR